MGTLHGRKKRRFLPFLLVLAALLLAAAAVFLLWRPLKGAPPAAEESATPGLTAEATPAENAVSAPAPEAAQPLQAGLSRYEAVLKVDADQMILYGNLRLTYVNRYAQSLFTVMLNLFPNAVSKDCLTLQTVTVEGLDAEYTLDESKTHLTLPLPRELRPGESAKIYLSYLIRIPKTNERFGAGENRIMFGNCIPIAAEFENGAWREDAYSDAGDSFYSSVADYRVSIAAPKDYTLSCTGAVEEQRTEKGVTTVLAAAREVRDFAFCLHKNAYTALRTVNGVEVAGVARTQKAAELAAQSGADALAFFSEKICEYPYPRFCVVDFDGSGGMEYPGLVMVDATQFNARQENYAAMIVAHEAAHQWFYGIVGSDQLNEPWVDESLAQFLGFDFIRSTMGDEAFEALWSYAFQKLPEYERTLRLDAPLTSFQGSDYFYVVYAYGAQMMRELYDALGAEAFYAALQNYVGEHRYQNAKGSDLIAAFSEAAGKDMAAWFEAKMEP
ncbi:MAG: M1 family metallopeptidase [Eubacteriales bacterium]|nr:M1 family metallopeptidase [Eubacteriales bacterium]